jgi:diguanylate cyclase (GGDEF)-like protein
LAVAAAEQCALALANVRLREKLAVQSVRDPLTGLYNRRFAEESITREIARAQRESKPLTLVILDLDGFKSFNDEYGHDGGDAALRAAATLLVESIRTSDVAARLGGDEFLLVLPGATVESAIAKCDFIRVHLRLQDVHHRGRRLPPITLSAGAAGFPIHGSNGDALLRAADSALYASKHAGRDRVMAAVATA